MQDGEISQVTPGAGGGGEEHPFMFLLKDRSQGSERPSWERVHFRGGGETRNALGIIEACGLVHATYTGER